MSISNKLIQAASGNAGSDNLYVEDVFSTYLYEGNDTDTNIVNGINLADEGGLVWIKSRQAAEGHRLIDSEWSLSANQYIDSSSTTAPFSGPVVNTFNTDGFQLDSNWYGNSSDSQYGGDHASWTFRKAKKFFDVVTYTGNDSDQNISHNLGSTPGFVIIKATSTTGNWSCWHSGLDAAPNNYILLNLNVGPGGNTVRDVNSSTFEVYGNYSDEGSNGVTYVAYLFASDAGGFGDDGSENIIKCGSYVGNGSDSGPVIDVGFEPQFVMLKAISRTGHWFLLDVMRGIVTATGPGSGGENQYILANESYAEGTTSTININASGFQLKTADDSANENNATYIYMAIRRPMKTPESGTEVLSTVAYTGTGADKFLTSSSVVDLAFNKKRTSGDWTWTGRLQGAGRKLVSNGDFPEGTDPEGIKGLDYNNGVLLGTNGDVNGNGDTYISYMLSRATGAFDVVDYTGDGASLSHNLGVIPEFIITKARGANGGWRVTSSATTGVLYIDANDAKNGTDSFQTLTPCTATTMNLSGISQNTTNIAYLFGTVAGVSKVGSVVHSGTTNVDCGFSAGARFVLVKRTDASGDWFIWDSVRGIVSGDDPYVRWNVSSAEATNTDYIDPLSSGFTLTSSFTAGTYIFLAIA